VYRVSGGLTVRLYTGTFWHAVLVLLVEAAVCAVNGSVFPIADLHKLVLFYNNGVPVFR
jgi:hypothetical protein